MPETQRRGPFRVRQHPCGPFGRRWMPGESRLRRRKLSRQTTIPRGLVANYYFYYLIIRYRDHCVFKKMLVIRSCVVGCNCNDMRNRDDKDTASLSRYNTRLGPTRENHTAPDRPFATLAASRSKWESRCAGS